MEHFNNQSRVKFATVREDPNIEREIINHYNSGKILMIASGGCTALSLQSMLRDIDITLFDTSYNQIQHVKNKVAALESNWSDELFNIGRDNPKSLNGLGEFESLFRCFRGFIFEFVMPHSEIEEIFLVATKIAREKLEKIFYNKYWSVAFDLYFSDSLLVTMFGSDAVQHAVPGTYPNYFRSAIEAGLRRNDFQGNYFLHHIFLGYYINRKSSLPSYLSSGLDNYNFNYINSSLLNIEKIDQYDFIGISNIFDWMDQDLIDNHLDYIATKAKTRSVIVYRQLNNITDYSTKNTAFQRNEELEKKLLGIDRSLFYNKINILEKT